MQLLKKVLIKQVITEKSKQTLRKKFENEIIQLERECQQLLFEQRKLKNRLSKNQSITDRFQIEIDQRKDKITIIEFKLEQLDSLGIGSEIIEREMDGLVDVEVGTDWKGIEKNPAIIVSDDVVIRIDEE